MFGALPSKPDHTRPSAEPEVLIVIPTFEEGERIAPAVEASLSQSYPRCRVLVVDDGSRDDTRARLARFRDNPRFCYLQLQESVGAARARNVGILLGTYDAVTFHDSDGLPHRDKIRRQVEALCQNPIVPPALFDWADLDLDPEAPQPVDVVLGAYELLRSDGRTDRISSRATLFDDFFPAAQQASADAADWDQVHSGLFHRRVFEALGGYAVSVEEQRELRNRLLACGMRIHFIEEALWTKIERDGAGAADGRAGYLTALHRRDQERVWAKVHAVRCGMWGKKARKHLAVPIDLAGVRIEEVSRPELLCLHEGIPTLPTTRARLSAWWKSCDGGR